MRWTPVLFLTACTLNGKPLFSSGGGATGTAPATGGASSSDTVAAAPATGARCPNGKKYALAAPEIMPGHGVQSIALADVNGDGKLDIVTGNPHHERPAKPHLTMVAAMLGKGGGAFADMAFSPAAYDRPGEFAEAETLSSGDLDGDGHADIVFSSPNTGLTDPLYMIGNGDGTFADSISLHARSDGGDALIADFNGDKKNDILIHDMLWLNNGSTGKAKFAGKTEIARDGDYRIRAEAVADFDGDGSVDVVAESIGGAWLLRNDGNGSFTVGAKFKIDDALHVAAGDVDGDGKPDIIVLAKESVALIMNKGGGKFAAPTYVKLPESTYPSFLTASDLNGDGKVDVVVVGGDNLVVLMSSGGALATPIKVAAGKPYKVVAGDLAGDKVQSLVVVGDPSADEDKSKLFVLRGTCR